MRHTSSPIILRDLIKAGEAVPSSSSLLDIISGLPPNNLHSNQLASASQSAVPALTDAQAVEACEDDVQRGLPLPRTFSRLSPSTGVDRAPGWRCDRKVRFRCPEWRGLPAFASSAMCLPATTILLGWRSIRGRRKE